MKSDTERKDYYTEKLHKRKNRMHVHLSKELRSKLKLKKRSVLVRKGDTVRVMRGPGKGKEAKVGDVNVVRRKVILEGVVAKNARGREIGIALEPSNLLLLALEPTKERKEIFSEEAFKKREAPKKETAKPEGEKAPAAKASGEKAESSAKGEPRHEHGQAPEHAHGQAHQHAPGAAHPHEGSGKAPEGAKPAGPAKGGPARK